MKYLATTTLMVLLTLTAVTSFAQQHPDNRSSPVKTALFNKFPNQINCTIQQLDKFFTGRENDTVDVIIGNAFSLGGQIKSNIIKYRNLRTVVVRLPQFNNILFTLSKTKDQENNIVYVGHLFDAAYTDGYELQQVNRETYQFVKIEMERLLPTCNQ